MNTYTVQVTRIEYASQTFIIAADNRYQAMDMAEEAAANFDFTDKVDSTTYEPCILKCVEEGETK